MEYYVIAGYLIAFIVMAALSINSARHLSKAQKKLAALKDGNIHEA